MKKFIQFILFLFVLIVSEYYFFIELFAQKRAWVLLPSLLVMGGAIYGILRFAKKTIISSKGSASHF